MVSRPFDKLRVSGNAPESGLWNGPVKVARLFRDALNKSLNADAFTPSFLLSQERRVGINPQVTDFFRGSFDYPGNTVHGGPAL